MYILRESHSMHVSYGIHILTFCLRYEEGGINTNKYNKTKKCKKEYIKTFFNLSNDFFI